MNKKFLSQLAIQSDRSVTSLKARLLLRKLHESVLLQYFARISAQSARHHALTQVRLKNELLIHDSLSTGRPIIFALLHEGFFLSAFNKLLTQFGTQREMNVFYADPLDTPTNQRFTDLLAVHFPNCKPLYNNTRGIVAARRALGNGECVFILPDVFTNLGETIYIPFFNKLYPTMPGTAYLGIKSEALIMPIITRTVGLARFDVLTPVCLDSRDYSQDPLDLAVHRLTADIWNVFERHLKENPIGWRFWDQYAQFSIPLPLRGDEFSLEQGLNDWSKRNPEFARFLAGV